MVVMVIMAIMVNNNGCNDYNIDNAIPQPEFLSTLIFSTHHTQSRKITR
jgi:hypothetical protein